MVGMVFKGHLRRDWVRRVLKDHRAMGWSGWSLKVTLEGIGSEGSCNVTELWDGWVGGVLKGNHRRGWVGMVLKGNLRRDWVRRVLKDRRAMGWLGWKGPERSAEKELG